MFFHTFFIFLLCSSSIVSAGVFFVCAALNALPNPRVMSFYNRINSKDSILCTITLCGASCGCATVLLPVLFGFVCAWFQQGEHAVVSMRVRDCSCSVCMLITCNTFVRFLDWSWKISIAQLCYRISQVCVPVCFDFILWLASAAAHHALYCHMCFPLQFFIFILFRVFLTHTIALSMSLQVTQTTAKNT